MAESSVMDKIKRLLVKFTIEVGQRQFGGIPMYDLLDPIAWKEETYIGKAANYEEDFSSKISEGFNSLNISREQIEGKHIILKPNLVETSSSNAACINTHPRVMLGTIEALQKLGAGKITIAEGAGHRRDS